MLSLLENAIMLSAFELLPISAVVTFIAYKGCKENIKQSKKFSSEYLLIFGFINITIEEVKKQRG